MTHHEFIASWKRGDIVAYSRQSGCSCGFCGKHSGASLWRLLARLGDDTPSLSALGLATIADLSSDDATAFFWVMDDPTKFAITYGACQAIDWMRDTSKDILDSDAVIAAVRYAHETWRFDR